MRTRTMRDDTARVPCQTQTRTSQPLGVKGSKSFFIGLALAGALISAHYNAMAMSVDLGTAAGFAVLAGSGITSAGATTITGNIGTYPTPTLTGPILILSGTDYTADTSVMQQAKSDLSAAYSDAAGQTVSTLYGATFDLGGNTLEAGVYKVTESFGITGTLTLDAQNNPDAVWIFNAGSTLTAATGSKVVLLNGAQAGNVFWLVGSSATLQTDAYFTGSILALTSITLNTGATVDGRVLAQNGAVTFDNNIVIVPECGTVQLLGIGLMTLAAFQRRRFSSYS